MPLVDVPGSLRLPLATRPFLDRVSLRISPEDQMFRSNAEHYLRCGASALNAILAALMSADAPSPKSILDFGAGAGRVTRWLRAAFPSARLAACDLRQEDVEFCKEEFDAETWMSGVEIPGLVAPRRYDVIWAGSVLTHLSAEKSAALIEKFLEWSNAGGLIVVSVHGRYAKIRGDSGAGSYVDAAEWSTITKGYDASGFGYADYPNRSGYGISLTKLSWLADAVCAMPEVRLVGLSERAWDSHQDIMVIQNSAVAGA